jgi:LysM repeat protein
LTYIQDDDENDECFRKYNDVLASYSDHSLFLKTRDRYAFLFNLQITDYKGWAYGLKTAGYATDQTYAARLISLIETHKLYEYDKMTIVPMEKNDQETLKNSPPLNNNKNLKIEYINGRKYVVARKGDTYNKIAGELDVNPRMLYRFNEVGESATLKPGEYVYIQPKRNKSDKEKKHTVKSGETMHSISQQYGIKLSSLYKLNNLDPGTQVKEGETVLLRKK